ncbi:MAG TPA: hypothetical protein VF857_08675, partial [Spirochaetota bacterium]
ILTDKTGAITDDLKDAVIGGNRVDREKMISDYGAILQSFPDILIGTEGTEEYVVMMLISLFREYFGEEITHNKIELF